MPGSVMLVGIATRVAEGAVKLQYMGMCRQSRRVSEANEVGRAHRRAQLWNCCLSNTCDMAVLQLADHLPVHNTPTHGV